MNAATLINQTSGEVEYYTPPEIIWAARVAMGGITLDPASSRAANENVGAFEYFTEGSCGLLQPWGTQESPSRVWLNHPFGRGLNDKWIGKLLDEYASGRIEAACAITYACTSENWFRPLLRFPQCFIHGRTNYLLPDGSVKRGVTKGSVVTYLGRNIPDFAKAFAPLGTIKIAL